MPKSRLGNAARRSTTDVRARLTAAGAYSLMKIAIPIASGTEITIAMMAMMIVPTRSPSTPN